MLWNERRVYEHIYIVLLLVVFYVYCMRIIILFVSVYRSSSTVFPALTNPNLKKSALPSLRHLLAKAILCILVFALLWSRFGGSGSIVVMVC